MKILTFRTNPAGLEGILGIENACFSDPWTPGMFRDSFNDPLSRCFAASADGKLAGFALMLSVAGEGEILRVAVSPDMRRLGVGAALMEALLAQSRSEALSALSLEVRASNAPALALYSRFGFVRTGLRANYYEHPSEDGVIMEKRPC